MSKVISFKLSTSDIDRAIKEINEYKVSIERKCERLRELIAENIAWSASKGFSTAITDDWIGEDYPNSNVTVSVTHAGNLSIVFTSGSDAVFIEFGAGVNHNGAVGGSPHPKGIEFGYTIGEYGKGYGANNVWGYTDPITGEHHVTRGTPAAMPMFHAAEEAKATAVKLAREVFGTND